MPLHLVSAFATTARLLLGQEAVASTSAISSPPPLSPKARSRRHTRLPAPPKPAILILANFYEGLSCGVRKARVLRSSFRAYPVNADTH